jgi:AraC-like DNA-binding protein
MNTSFKPCLWSPYPRLVHDFKNPATGEYVYFKSQLTDHALHYFLSGSGKYNLEGKTYRIEPHMLFAVRPDTGYSFNLFPNTKPRMLNIHFDPIEQEDSNYPFPYPPGKRTVPPVVMPRDFPSAMRMHNHQNYEQLFYQLHAIWQLPGMNWRLKSKSLMLEILGLLYTNTGENPPGTETFHRETVKKALEHIQQNLHRKIPLDELVAASEVCRALFIRIFKEECGMPPARYISKLKIDKAKNELAYHDTPIKELADNLGFVNVHHFTRIFREFAGIPPGQYKKHIK